MTSHERITDMFRKTLVGVLLGALLIVGGTRLITAATGDTRLSEAAMNGDKATVRTLLTQKVDVNVAQGDGTTPLHWAATETTWKWRSFSLKLAPTSKLPLA